MFRKCRVASIAVAAIWSLATTSMSSADDMGGSLKDMPSAAETYLWNGFYVGVGIGAGSFDQSVDVDASKSKTVEKRHKECVYEGEFCSYEWGPWKEVWSSTKDKSFTSSDDDWDVFGTLKIGYDRLIHERFLIGAFADVDFYSNSDHTFSEPWVEDYKEIGSIDGSFEIDNVLSAGVRAGLLLTPRILAYAVGGYSRANVDGDVDVSFKDGTILRLGGPDDLDGYFVGGGAEIKLRRNVSLQFEYRYTDLDSDSASASHTSVKSWGNDYCETRVTKTYNAFADFDGDIQSVRAVLVFKLDTPAHHVEPLK
jgi:outer membrane immunogenic protein